METKKYSAEQVKDQDLIHLPSFQLEISEEKEEGIYLGEIKEFSLCSHVKNSNSDDDISNDNIYILQGQSVKFLIDYIAMHLEDETIEHIYDLSKIEVDENNKNKTISSIKEDFKTNFKSDVTEFKQRLKTESSSLYKIEDLQKDDPAIATLVHSCYNELASPESPERQHCLHMLEFLLYNKYWYQFRTI